MSRGKNANCLVIALSSGKLFKPSIQLFEGIGIDLKGGKEISRKLTFFDQVIPNVTHINPQFSF